MQENATKIIHHNFSQLQIIPKNRYFIFLFYFSQSHFIILSLYNFIIIIIYLLGLKN